ncbi:peptidoglycan DD-metalloendopeptidase family protein [Streptomyces sp. NPDC091292]|uniref:M23 family metallopeptidase n=1 Tax=Streptomyces sp. NPDC091292 TaxID=3365991 RepID=UPI003801599E
MPAKGKHRRPKAQRLTRGIAVAGTGGAALALPLIGATGAHAAAPQSAPVAAEKSAATLDQAAARKAEAAQSAETPTVTTYTVKPGDYLSKIAQEQSVSGGWHQLYEDNREAVGENPSLIHPGLQLTIGGTAADAPAADPSSASSSDDTAAPSTDPAPAAPSAPSDDTAAPADQGASTSTDTAGSGYTLPVDGGAVGTPYHQSGSMWSSGYHTGVDFVVPTGTTIKSVGPGTVVSAGWGGAYGNQVVVQHTDGQYSQYAHLSQLSVSAGQTVAGGQQLGLSGATGNVTGPHLHFEIRTGPDYGSDVDPLAYLRSHGVGI